VRTLRRPRRRWKDNTKMHRVKIMLDGVDLIYLGHDKAGRRDLVNTVMKVRAP
jgi:hypothetical protein